MQEICYNCDAVKLTKGVCQISEFSWARKSHPLSWMKHGSCQTKQLSVDQHSGFI